MPTNDDDNINVDQLPTNDDNINVDQLPTNDDDNVNDENDDDNVNDKNDDDIINVDQVPTNDDNVNDDNDDGDNDDDDGDNDDDDDDNDDDYDDDNEETESCSEAEWNSTGYEPAVNHEDRNSFFDIVKDELSLELYSKFIEFCKSINKCRLKFHMTQNAISSVHEAHKNMFELDSKNQKLQNFMTKFVNSIYLQKKFSENLPTYVKSEELKLTSNFKMLNVNFN